MAGTLVTGKFSIWSLTVSDDSIGLNQIEDVTITTESHNDVLRFNDNITDPTFTDGFVNKSFGIENVDDINVSSTSTHNTIMTFNDNSIVSEIVDGWINKVITDIITGFQITIEGLVNIELSLTRGREGNPGLSDSVAFADESTGNGGFTMGIASAGDNNVILKREPTDEDFVYLQTMSKGEQAAYSIFPAGTIFRSTKGMTGFSGPFPLPFGIASLSSNYFRFYSLRFNSFAYCTSAGLETVVTLFASDETTIIDGPHTIGPYQTVALDSGPDNTEFVVVATNNVYCGTSSTNTDTGATNLDPRLIPPMTNEIITYNRLIE